MTKNMDLIKKQLATLPRTPGVYLFKNAKGNVLYVGKATVIKTRVSSYFQKRSSIVPRPIEDALHEVANIEAVKTGTVIEALLLEAQLIKDYWPPYNVLGKDNKSFLYVVITRDIYSKVELIRGNEISHGDEKKYAGVFGPYTSSTSIREALKIIRKIFPYSNCNPPIISRHPERSVAEPKDPVRIGSDDAGDPSASHQDDERKPSRSCFYYHLKLCPGVCVGAIKPREYKKTIRHIIKFFQGKKSELIRELTRDMQRAAKENNFEVAAVLRNQIFALEHIRDIALIREEFELRSGNGATDLINVFGRIEGYDISNISGTHNVGSMVVFENGEPNKKEYRLFKIKTVDGANDVASLREVLMRRFGNDWAHPDIICIDGGVPQVNTALSVIKELNLKIPVLGIAKGAERKRNDMIIPAQGGQVRETLTQLSRLHSHIFIAVRDESHRFAQKFYRSRHAKGMIDRTH